MVIEFLKWWATLITAEKSQKARIAMIKEELIFSYKSINKSVEEKIY